MQGEYELSIDFCGIRMQYPWMNASGILSNLPVIERYQHLLGAGVTKSVGITERHGNETPIVARSSQTSLINAVGLPNAGYKHLAEELEDSDIEIPLFVSVFGNNPDEVHTIVGYLDSCPHVSGFELNYSCPNIRPGEQTGMTIGKDPKLTEEYTFAASNATEKPLIVKHTPATYIFDPGLFREVVHAAKDGGCHAHAAINTIPGGMVIDIHTGRPVLTAGRGGVSGPGVKPIGIGCVRAIREYSDKPIIGMGGISDAEDVAEYMMAGASAVAIGTGLEDDYMLRNLPVRMRTIVRDMGLENAGDLTGWER